MSKLGDLIVRLRLQYDDYKKGLKKADADTKGFAGTLGKIKGVGLAVWGAIGGAVIGFANEMIKSTNRIGDAWARFTAQASAAWTTFVQSVSAMRWDNLIGRIKEATAAAKDLQNALDAEFEVSNSIRLQKAAMAEELAALEVLARNASKPYEERAAAAQKYLDMVKPLYDQELRLAKSLEDAQLGKWLAGSGLNDSEQLRKDLRAFLIAYGKDQNLMNALGIMIDANSRNVFGSQKLASAQVNGDKAYVAQYRAAQQFVTDYQKNNGYGTSIYKLAEIYEKMRGDADTKPLVDAMIAAGEAAGAFDRETKRMQSTLNTSLAQMEGSTGTAVGSVEAVTRKALGPALTAGSAITVGPLVAADSGLAGTEAWMAEHQRRGEEFLAWYQDMVDRTAMMNQMLEDSIVQATVGGLQAFTDMVSGIEGADASDVLAALLQPFANTATQLGSMLLAEGLGIKAFKESLKTLNPAIAIGAGTALIALGAALGSAIRALGGSGSSSSGSNGGYDSGGSSAAGQNYESTLTVEVTGKISGSDIVISGNKTNDKWNR
jgi:hypothetical protein